MQTGEYKGRLHLVRYVLGSGDMRRNNVTNNDVNMAGSGYTIQSTSRRSFFHRQRRTSYK